MSIKWSKETHCRLPLNDPNATYKFWGNQVNLKTKNGWLVGFNKGEWGGNLFWFSTDGKIMKHITEGNINDIFHINNRYYVTEGLSHFGSRGSIFEVFRNNMKWEIGPKVELDSEPYATIVNTTNEFIIATTKNLIKVDTTFKIDTLISEAFWDGRLFPNSILIHEEKLYIGMRAGIFKTDFPSLTNQEWLTVE